jgi:PBP1b-binding outer membrane lipoprotein LpoB
MKKKLFALLLLATAFAGCSQLNEVKDGVKQAPTDFWDSLHSVLAFIVDLVSGVAWGWIKGLFGL